MAVLRCTEGFAYTDRKTGAPRVVRSGDLVDAKDPVVKGRESMFEPVEATVDRASDRSVEQATAAPGEKRAASKGAASKRTRTPADADD